MKSKAFVFVCLLLPFFCSIGNACDILDPQGLLRGSVSAGVVRDMSGVMQGQSNTGDVYDINRRMVGKVRNGVIYDAENFIIARVVGRVVYNSSGGRLGEGRSCTNLETGAGVLLLLLQ